MKMAEHRKQMIWRERCLRGPLKQCVDGADCENNTMISQLRLDNMRLRQEIEQLKAERAKGYGRQKITTTP